jgi:hypothetical protein
VLIISPHFPPDSSAATHRVRLLAPHLARFGWEPTVLTLEPAAYEGRLDPVLADLVHGPVRVVRARALPARLTRRVGIGDLGLRSFPGLYRAASGLLSSERFDALFITIFPAYTALLGPLLVRRFGVPFVLDYQDPWVNAWGVEIGGGSNGRVDFKSRASRFLAERLEPLAVGAASAITAVSPGTYAPILERNPHIHPVTAAIPIGADPGDFQSAALPPSSAGFEPGRIHLCHVGTIAPLGLETVRAVLQAIARIRASDPDLYDRLRVHFIGTSNQSIETSDDRVAPLARALGVADVVREAPTRVPYSTAIQMMRGASALLVLGSTEAHYTASKVFPLLLAERPIVAVCHEGSTVTDILRAVARPPSVRLVTYSDRARAEAHVDEVRTALTATCRQPVWDRGAVDSTRFSEFLAESLAGRLAAVFDQIAGSRAA